MSTAAVVALCSLPAYAKGSSRPADGPPGSGRLQSLHHQACTPGTSSKGISKITAKDLHGAPPVYYLMIAFGYN